MGQIFKEGIAQITRTSGTGDYTLAGVPTGSVQGVDAAMADGDTGYFQIDWPGGPGKEILFGTFTAPSTLARTAIVSSSNADAPVDWPSSGQRIIRMIRRPDVLYEMPMFFPGVLSGGSDDNRSRGRIATTQGADFLADFSGSMAHARIAATADTTFDINDVDDTETVTAIGSIVVSAGSRNGTFTSTGGDPVSMEGEHMIEVLAPSTADATLADFALTIVGKRKT